MSTKQGDYIEPQEARKIVLATSLYKAVYLPLDVIRYEPLMIPATSIFIPAYLANLEDLLLLATLVNNYTSRQRICEEYPKKFKPQAYVNYRIRAPMADQKNALTERTYKRGMYCLVDVYNYIKRPEAITLTSDAQGIEILTGHSVIRPVIAFLQSEIARQKVTAGYTIFKLELSKYWHIIACGNY